MIKEIELQQFSIILNHWSDGQLTQTKYLILSVSQHDKSENKGIMVIVTQNS